MPDFMHFRASRFSVDTGKVMAMARTTTSLRDQQVADRWQRRLEPWLLAGDPLGSAYLDFGHESAFLRWHREPETAASAWDQALVLVADSARLPGVYALELLPLQLPYGAAPGPDEIRLLAPDAPTGPRRDALAALVRSPEALAALVPALANALDGERRVILPWFRPQIADAAMWGFLTILRLTCDNRPASFRTHVTGPTWDGDSPGILVTFRPDIAKPRPQPEPGFAILAGDLAARFAEAPAELARMLADRRLHEMPRLHDRVRQLLALPLSRPWKAEPPSMSVPPRIEPEAVDGGEKATVTVSHGPSGPTITCPICLADIDNWGTQGYWRYDPHAADEWVKIDIPADLSPAQRSRYQAGAHVRCEKGAVNGNFHHLPARYGRFGEPVLLGFVGLTESGKSHLLTAMVGCIKGLSEYQITVNALDPAMHERFVKSSVEPLMSRGKALPGTQDGATALKDAFIVRYGTGPERVVALFDVSGGDLADTGMGREFLWIADGLFFVIDPDHIAGSKAGDVTFDNVLSIVRDRAKPGPKGASIILSKADKGRFEEPAVRWLRAGDGALDPADFLRESADVYAYLQRHGALALAAPYEAAMCEKATLHIAAPTGGAKEHGEDGEDWYPRGVTPTRVLRPLLAMLAMTGVLTGPQAELIGV